MSGKVIEHAAGVATYDTLCGDTWWASCICGWQGQVRRSQLGEQIVDARSDGYNHLRAAAAASSSAGGER